MKTYTSTHMVKMLDLNHHKNLYAGRGIEWMVEASFFAATLEYGEKHGLLFKNCHKFDFMKSVLPGEIVTYRSTVVRVGKTSFTVHVDLISEETGEVKADAYVTYVTVKPDSNILLRHSIVLDETEDPQELKWREEAARFFVKKA